MIAHVKGRVASVTDNSAVIDIGGVGLFISLCQRTAATLTLGEDIFLYTHFQLREDGISLYGFCNEVERQIFQMVIGVSGVGPKVAMNLLSTYSSRELVRVFLERDTSALSHVPGIGKKTAERLVIELADKAAKLQSGIFDSSLPASDLSGALDLLMELGASRKEALDALEKVRKENKEPLATDELITRSLAFLGGRVK